MTNKIKTLRGGVRIADPQHRGCVLVLDDAEVEAETQAVELLSQDSLRFEDDEPSPEIAQAELFAV